MKTARFCGQALKTFLLNAPAIFAGKVRSLGQALKLFLRNAPALYAQKARYCAQALKSFLRNAPAIFKDKARSFEQAAKNRISLWRRQARQGMRAALGFLFSVKTLISLIIILSIAVMSMTAVQGYYAGFGTVVLVDGEEVGFLYDEEVAQLDEFVASLDSLPGSTTG
jgi:hypothetical protein